MPNKAEVEFLIATVPDPQTTHLALYFDRTLESLTWALTDAGYVFQNAWLPWTELPEKGLSAFSDINCQKARLERLRDLPGLMIFRRNGAEPDKDAALFVFLAGETPTGGVHKTEFANAVDYIRAIRAAERTVRVVGPNFSGSFRPLAGDILALSVPNPDLQFRFVTGVATNYGAASDFKTALAGRAKLESVIENDERAGNLYMQYVGWQCLRPPRVAILSEDETVYGNFFKQNAAANESQKEEDKHRRLALTYPRGIADLRNAYREEGALSSEGRPQATPNQGAQRTFKDVSDSDSLNERDSIPAFSPRQSPASQQAALSGIAANLRRDRVDLTGIIATDILDNLFLTRFLRMNSPDIRIFALDADLLFPWEEEDSPFLGILSVTTYPLIGRNQHWTNAVLPGPIPRRIQFSSRYAEGTYNACSRLIYRESRAESLLEYCRPIQPAGTQPPLWLTTAGRDGYWPIALLDQDAHSTVPSSLLNSMNSPEIEPQLHPEYPPRAWYLSFWVVLLFCWLHCLYLWRLLAGPANRQPSPDPSPGPLARIRQIGDAFWDRLLCLSSIFKAYPERNLEPRERPFLEVATLSAACVVIALTFSLARFLFPYPSALSTPLFWAAFYSFLGGITAIALLVTAAKLHSKCYKKLTVPSWAIAVGFWCVWIWLNVDPRYRSGLFFAYRNLNLGSGVSPALPVLLLSVAYYGWSWVHLKREGEILARRRFVAEVEAEAEAHREFLGEDSSILPSHNKLVIAVDQVLENIFSDRLLVPAALFIMLWFLLFTPWLSVRSLEHWPYDVLFGLLQAVLYWSMAVSWMQFMLSWGCFKRYLQSLERQPIRSAFSRLRKEISWVPLVSTKGPETLFISTRGLDCLNAIMKFDEAGIEGPRLVGLRHLKWMQAVNAERIRQYIIDINGNLSAGEPVDPDSYTKLQICFEKAAQAIAQSLKATVWQLGDSDSLSREIKTRDEKGSISAGERLTILEEEFIALRHLIYLRYVFRQLRNLLGFIVGGFILSVISFSSYPFQGHRSLSFASLIAFLALGVGVGIVFAEMDRDAILSRLTETNANEVGKTFFMRLVQYGSLPLLTLLASQFSWVNHALFSWLQPVLEALH